MNLNLSESLENGVRLLVSSSGAARSQTSTALSALHTEFMMNCTEEYNEEEYSTVKSLPCRALYVLAKFSHVIDDDSPEDHSTLVRPNRTRIIMLKTVLFVHWQSRANCYNFLPPTTAKLDSEQFSIRQNHLKP